MKRFGLFCLLAVLAAVVSLSAAKAQIPTQLYASPTGAAQLCNQFSSCVCSASAPCSLLGALEQAATHGSANNPSTIISCITGGFAQDAPIVEIGFAFNLTIDCPGAVLTPGSASDFAAGITLTGGSTQVVILRNLTFDGANQLNAPFIKAQNGTTLIIENCKFQNMGNKGAIAIQFVPILPAAQLIIRDSVFANNGVAPGTGGGLQVAPGSGGSASARLERVSFDFNITSMVLSGPVDATMINSTVSASRNTGIIVGSGAKLDVFDSTLAGNAGSAISVSTGGTVRLSNNTIKSNQIGVSNSGGHVFTYSNNAIFGNGSTAALTPIQRNQ